MNAISLYIQNATNVVILTHQSPDGDAMGSALAVMHYLHTLNKMAQVIVPNAFPDFLTWMPGAEEVLIYDANPEQAIECLNNADLVVCTDFNDPKRIGALGDKLLTMACPKIMIDHHLHPADFADFIVSVPEASSTCELVYEVIGDKLQLNAKEIATCL